MRSLATCLTLLIGSTATIPVPGLTLEERTCKACTKSFNASFDDIKVPAFGVSSPGQVVETPYQNLGWKNLAPRSQPLFTPLIFNSQKNNAIIETTDTLNGKPAVLYADYPNSPVYTFKLKSFYFGCKLATPQQGNGGPAQKCTVSITGTKNDGKKTKPAQCSFDPGTSPDGLGVYFEPEVLCRLPDTFKELKNVEVKVTDAQLSEKLTVLYTDNFVYDTTGVCC